MRPYPFLYLLVLLYITSCKQPQTGNLVTFNGLAQGTYYAVTYQDNEKRDFQPQIDSLLAAFDQSVSFYVDSSIISRMNANAGEVYADDIFRAVFGRSQEVSASTDGAFDITVMPLVDLWGFGLKNAAKVSDSLIAKAMPLVGFSKVSLTPEGKLIKENPAIQLNFNAIAQGYSVDLIGKFLEARSINNYLVDVGGEVLGKGLKAPGKPWRVGIEKPAENPDDDRVVQVVMELYDKALATSGNYRKFIEREGKKYSHTIDPKTGRPVDHHVLSVSVLADDCMTADAYATAFMVMGLDRSKDFLAADDRLQAYVIYTDSTGRMLTWKSAGMPDPVP